MKIKFKVYDEENKKYQNNPLIMGNNGEVAFTQKDQNNFTILQHTGFDDIYEGDVVYDQYNEDYGIVVWDEDMGRWAVEFENEYLLLGDGYSDYLNIIAHYPTTIEEAYQNYLKEYGDEK